MKKLIVTADDYGVFPNINKGVIDAVNSGAVNSVAVFANYNGLDNNGVKKYPDSVENTIDLLNKTNGKAEIGCHLTITSGKPLTYGTITQFTTSGNFREYYDLLNFNYEPAARALKSELIAQVERLNAIPGCKVKHLTCHHDSLTFFKNYYDVYLDVADTLKLPIRSPDIRPWKNTVKYKWIIRARLFEDMKWKDRKEVTRFQEQIIKYFYSKSKSIRTTNYMDSRHYGPPPIMHVKQIDLPRIVKEKGEALRDMISEFATSPEDVRTMEIMLHLAKDDITNINTYDDIDYSGVHRGYFGGRIAEFNSVTGFDFKSQLQGIQFSSWNDI